MNNTQKLVELKDGQWIDPTCIHLLQPIDKTKLPGFDKATEPRLVIYYNNQDSEYTIVLCDTFDEAKSMAKWLAGLANAGVRETK